MASTHSVVSMLLAALLLVFASTSTADLVQEMKRHHVPLPTPTNVPGAVTNLMVVGATTTSLTVSMAAPVVGGQTVDGITVSYRLAGSGGYTVLEYSFPGFYYEVTDLTPNTAYDIKIKGVNDQGSGPAQRVTGVTLAVMPATPAPTTAVTQLPDPVNNLSVVRITATMVHLWWSPPIGGGQWSVFRIHKRLASGGPWQLVNYDAFAIEGFTYMVYGLQIGQSYDLSVTSANILGRSGRSIVTVTTDASGTTIAPTPPVGVPERPQDITVTGRNETALLITWTAPAYGYVETYRIVYKASGGSWNVVSENWVDTQVLITGLTDCTTYIIKIKGSNHWGRGKGGRLVTHTYCFTAANNNPGFFVTGSAFEDVNLPTTGGVMTQQYERFDHTSLWRGWNFGNLDEVAGLYQNKEGTNIILAFANVYFSKANDDVSTTTLPDSEVNVCINVNQVSQGTIFPAVFCAGANYPEQEDGFGLAGLIQLSPGEKFGYISLTTHEHNYRTGGPYSGFSGFPIYSADQTETYEALVRSSGGISAAPGYGPEFQVHWRTIQSTGGGNYADFDIFNFGLGGSVDSVSYYPPTTVQDAVYWVHLSAQVSNAQGCDVWMGWSVAGRTDYESGLMAHAVPAGSSWYVSTGGTIRVTGDPLSVWMENGDGYCRNSINMDRLSAQAILYLGTTLTIEGVGVSLAEGFTNHLRGWPGWLPVEGWAASSTFHYVSPKSALDGKTFVAPSDGVYYVDFQALFISYAGMIGAMVAINDRVSRLNGLTNIVETTSFVGPRTIKVNNVVRLQAGDTLTAYISGDSGIAAGSGFHVAKLDGRGLGWTPQSTFTPATTSY